LYEGEPFLPFASYIVQAAVRHRSLLCSPSRLSLKTTQNPYVFPSDRKRQAFLFAKHSWFFSNSQYAWSDDILESAVSEFNLTLLSACVHDETTVIPKAITWLGTSLPQEEFLKTVGESVVLVGVGGELARSKRRRDEGGSGWF